MAMIAIGSKCNHYSHAETQTLFNMQSYAEAPALKQIAMLMLNNSSVVKGQAKHALAGKQANRISLLLSGEPCCYVPTSTGMLQVAKKSGCSERLSLKHVGRRSEDIREPCEGLLGIF